ncbi:MAG: RNA polymerase sigma factor [Acidobacteria bacterium]|nr:RNA polymerase sigma factor [Acidobacteriota bacterium]
MLAEAAIPDRSVAAAAADAPAAETTSLDAARLESLYARLEKPMFNVVYRWLWNRADAQEVVQDAFVRVWRRRDVVRMETVEALLYRTALNLASNRLRAQRLRRWLSLEALFERGGEAEAPATGPDDRARDAAIRAAVEALPDRLRRVVMLCEFSELSYDQVAATLGIPPGTVASRRNKALAVLRERLGDER